MKESRWLGLVALVGSVLIIFVWIPFGVETGLIEKVRRSVQIGDAFAPTVAGLIIGLGGTMVLLGGRHHRPASEQTQCDAKPLSDHLLHALALLLMIALALGLMRFAGSTAVALFYPDATEYRLLRDTVPWKYVGFILGGTFLVATLIGWAERKLKWIHVWIGLLATLVLLALYDLPFNDLLLPPNGDV